MKVCILMGSPRKQGNTNALLGPFRQELEGLGAETETVWLHALEIRPCTACRACQRDWTAFGCAQRDDVPMIFDKVLACDLIVLATPIYSDTARRRAGIVGRRNYMQTQNYCRAEKGPAWSEKAPGSAADLRLPPGAGLRPVRGGDAPVLQARPAPFSGQPRSGTWGMTSPSWTRRKRPRRARQGLWITVH